MAPRLVLFFSLALGVCLCGVLNPKNAKEIFSLPNAPPLKSPMYSGFLKVSESPNARNLFFVLQEAVSADPATAPTLLWLQGGPGCSSLIGFLSENGPFYPNKDGSLSYNEFAWGDKINMLWIEAPAGVGFSTVQNEKDLDVGDQRTAQDSFAALELLVKNTPLLRGREFFIAGESYGGHYVPTLALEVVKRGGFGMQFKGVLVGNPLTEFESDNQGWVEDWWTHSLISDLTHQQIISYCNFTTLFPQVAGAGAAPNPTLCSDAVNQAVSEMGPVDPYSIYTPTCTTDLPLTQDKALLAHARRTGRPGLGSLAARPVTSFVAPCLDDYLTAYLNDKQVQEVIGVPVGFEWGECSGALNYSIASIEASMLPVYKYLIQKGVRVQIYSGDTDGVLPTTGTRLWINKMGLEIVTPFHPWTVIEDPYGSQVGGWAIEYKGLNLVIVRNAGHMVPKHQPARAKHMLEAYLAGRNL